MKVDFYHLDRRGQDVGLIALASKIFDAEKRAVLLCATGAEASRLDDLLWMQKPDTFWAHGVAGGSDDASQPLLISTALTEVNQPAFGILFNLIDYPDNLGSVERVLVPFNGDDAMILAATRRFYADLKEKGADLAYWKLENGKWVKKG